MTGRVFRRPRVDRDLIEHFVFIARDSLESAEHFLDVAEKTFKRLAENPLIGQAWESPLRKLAGMRAYCLPLPFRRYVAFYRPVDGGVEIVTVLHGSRDLDAVLRRS